ncbi:hypothetical protein ACHWQZ_G014442 [Mnemiopsis leidyi]
MTTIEITLSVLDSLYDAAKAKGAWNCKVSLTSFREEFVKWVQGFDAGDEIVKRAENQAQVLFKKIQRHRGLHTRDKAAVDKNEIILSLSLPGNNAAPLASQSELCQQDKRRRSKQPIDELSSKRHRYRRLEPLIEQIKATAEEENTEIPHLLGLILHKLYYHSDRRVANIASQLIDISNENISKVAVPVASHIKSYCNLGREGYQRLTRSLKTSDLDVLPSWKTVRAYERTLTPEVKELEDKMGVEFDYKEALGKSAEQIIKQLDPKPTDTKLTLTVKDGLDGSGSHSIFNQDGNKNTHNIVITMFTPLSLISSNGDTIWVEPSPASPLTCRPLSLLLGKETDDVLKSYYRKLALTRENVRQESLQVTVSDCTYTIKVDLTLSMIDGKMRGILSGLGGAFCLLCTVSREKAADPQHVCSINRSSTEIAEIWRKLQSGELVKKAYDTDVRQGVTQEPIVSWEDIAIISPLHCFLRSFDFLLKIVYHLNAGVFNWSNEEKTLGYQYRFLKQSKESVRAHLKEQTHLAIDIPDSTGKGGTSTTGNVVNELLGTEKNLTTFVSQVPERFQGDMHDICSRIYAICRLYNSCEKLDTVKFQELCSSTKEMILTKLNQPGAKKGWIYLTPTVHAVLEHAPELVEANDGIGLGSFTESSLECNNKVLRLVRMKLSRKRGQIENLSDCLERMFVRSDLEVRLAVAPKRQRVRQDYYNFKHSFNGPQPFPSLSDYYMNTIVLK